MKKTILHEKHLTLGARMGEFGGWDMPIQYEGILAEHQQTRTESSLFDICHMGEFEISGAYGRDGFGTIAYMLDCITEGGSG